MEITLEKIDLLRKRQRQLQRSKEALERMMEMWWRLWPVWKRRIKLNSKGRHWSFFLGKTKRLYVKASKVSLSSPEKRLPYLISAYLWPFWLLLLLCPWLLR